MTKEIEVEAKFAIANSEQLAALLASNTLFGRYPLSTVAQVIHIDTYFDTIDYQLLRNGQTLRLRRSGDELWATAKSMGVNTPKGVHTRVEIERQVEDNTLSEDATALSLAQLPADVTEALGELIAPGQALHPLCRLEQVRDKRQLAMRRKVGSEAKLTPLAELSIDRVVVQQPAPRSGNGAAPGWRVLGEFDELEIELDEAAPKRELKQIAARMRELPGLVPNWQNKLQRGLMLIASAPHEPGAGARRHMAELCRDIWRQQLTVMLMNEAGVRFSDDIEYIHDMRVATRRARAAARLYAQYFDSKAVATFIKRLRTTGRLLGAVRDMDVAIAKMENYRSQGKEDDLGPVLDEWSGRRAKAHARLLEWLDSRQYAKFIAEFAKFCQTPGIGVAPFVPKPGKAPQPYQVRHVIPSMLMSRFEAVRAFEVLFETGEQPPVETLHALRIECKYLRYHLEFASDLLSEEGGELIERLRQLQEHLGELNDAVVSHAMLADKSDSVEAVERYRAAQAEKMHELEAALPADLASFLSQETRRKLALALARI